MTWRRPGSRRSTRTSAWSRRLGAGLDAVYLGFTNTFKPFDNARVRQALALGIDRKHLVATFLPPAAEVAAYAAPCTLPYACKGANWYDFDATLAKETLTAAGYPDGFTTTIHYSTTPSAAIPDPLALALEVQSELQTNLGITADLVGEPDATYRAAVDAGSSTVSTCSARRRLP